MHKKWFVSIAFLLLVFTVAACNSDDDNSANNEEADSAVADDKESNSQDGESEEVEMPEPDLEGVPDVVAEVNGEEILKEEFETTYVGQFQQAMMQAQMSGQEVDQEQLREQIANALVNQRLVIQEAENSDYEVTKEAMDSLLDQLVAQNGLTSQDDFLDALEEQGMSNEEVMEQVEIQVKIDKLIDNETGEVNPTEEELQEMYDAYTEQLEEMGGEDVEIPSFEEMEDDLINQVKAGKQNEAYQTLIERLQSDADITINL